MDTAHPSESISPVPQNSAPSRSFFSDSIRFWEPRRLVYNLVLFAVCVAWVALSWPHFRPAFTWSTVPPLTALAVIANVCFCAAYLVDLPLQHSSAGDAWRRRRWVLWLVGTIFAILLANYWIVDEIYPFVR